VKKIKIIRTYNKYIILNMPHLISNLYEKSYTPFTAKLAPRNLWNRPVLGK
jgi:hypothetical protein